MKVVISETSFPIAALQLAICHCDTHGQSDPKQVVAVAKIFQEYLNHSEDATEAMVKDILKEFTASQEQSYEGHTRWIPGMEVEKGRSYYFDGHLINLAVSKLETDNEFRDDVKLLYLDVRDSVTGTTLKLKYEEEFEIPYTDIRNAANKKVRAYFGILEETNEAIIHHLDNLGDIDEDVCFLDDLECRKLVSGKITLEKNKRYALDGTVLQLANEFRTVQVHIPEAGSVVFNTHKDGPVLELNKDYRFVVRCYKNNGGKGVLFVEQAIPKADGEPAPGTIGVYKLSLDEMGLISEGKFKLREGVTYSFEVKRMTACGVGKVTFSIGKNQFVELDTKVRFSAQLANVNRLMVFCEAEYVDEDLKLFAVKVVPI